MTLEIVSLPICCKFVTIPDLVPRVSHLAAPWNPGWVWSRATLTIENIREGSSVIRQVVAYPSGSNFE